MEKTNTNNYNTPYSKVYNFKNFNADTEIKDLGKTKRSFVKNYDDMYELPNNNKMYFNKITKTMQTLSKDQIKDKIEAAEDYKEEEKKESKIYESEDSRMNKLEALKYMSLNGQRNNEWQEAGLCDVLINVILSNENAFEKDYLDNLLNQANNN